MRGQRQKIFAPCLLVVLFLIVEGCTSQKIVAPNGSSKPGPQGQVVGVVLREFEFEPKPIKARTGRVRFQLMNRGTVEHDFVIPAIQQHGDHELHLLKPGETRVVEIELRPGSYEVICTVRGHREAGMVGRIEVGSQQ